MKIDQSVIDILDRSTTVGRQLWLPQQLPRSEYVQVDKALKAAGGKWDKQKRSHVFDESALDAVQPMILTGEVVRTKQDLGQFFTPPEIADQVAFAASLEGGMTALEPSAGNGALVEAASRVAGDLAFH